MADMKISGLVRRDFVFLQSDETLASAAKKMEDNGLIEMPVLSERKFAGVLRISDLAAAMMRPNLFQRPVVEDARKVQNQAVIRHLRLRNAWIRPESDIVSVFLYIKRHGASVVPIVDRQMKVTGVIHASDVCREISEMLLEGQAQTAPEKGGKQEQLEGQTPIDQLVNLVNREGSVSVADAAKRCRLSRAEIQDYAKSLEKSNIIRIEYGILGMRLAKPYQKPKRGV